MTDYQRMHPSDVGAPPDQQQTLLDFAVSHSPAIFYIAVLEAEQPVKFISKNVETITGHKVEAFLAETGYGRRFVHPDDLPAYARQRHAIEETGELIHEYRFRTTEGDYLWFRDELRLVGGGDEREIVGCMIEISQEKEAEAERERMSQLFHDAVESLENGFTVVDGDGKLVACNSALARNFDFDAKEFVGAPRLALARQTSRKMRRFDGEPVEQTEDWVQRIHDRIGQSVGAPIEVELHGGRWVLLNSHPTSEGGRVTIGTDITRLKQVENELRRSERYFRSMVMDNPLPVWLVDLESAEIIYASPAAAKLVGRPWPFEPPAYTTEFFLDVADRQAMIKQLWDKDGLIVDYETRFRCADGRVIWVALNTRLVEYQGRTASITGIVDLTERKRRELELRQAQETLEDAIESLSEGFILYDAEDRLVLCNEQYKRFNDSVRHMLVPGTSWLEITRERMRQSQFPNAVADPDTWLAERIAERGLIDSEEFPVAGGRWFEHSHRRTRQGGVVITWRDITERREREEALKRAHETLEDAVGSLSEGLVLYDAEDRLVLCNEQYKSFNNAVADLLVPGVTWTDVIRERTRRGLFPDAIGKEEAFVAARLAERGQVDNVEFKVADGRWFAHSHRRTRQGGVVITWSDITERRERREALRHAHETLEDAIESLSEGFALYDAEDRLVMCNQRYREFNLVCADILEPGLAFPELIRTGAARGEYDAEPDRVEQWLADYSQLRTEAGSIANFEYETTAGEWFSYSSQPTRRHGRVATLNDITERKKMERAIRENEALVRLILDASPVPLTMARAEDGRIIYESPAAATVFGYDPVQGYGTVVDRWPEAAERQKLTARLRRAGAVDGMETELLRSDGSTFPAALSARLIDYKGEEVVISSVFDLTERTAMDEEMRRQREIVHQSEKMSALGQLLASVAHELNNPLSVVVGQALLLKETAEDKAIAKRAERIGNAAERCARIVKTFLAMARQQPQESMPVDPNDLVEAALEVTGYSLRASDIEVSMSLSRSLPPVLADADQLTQVFTNLLVNAEQALRDAPMPRRLRITSRLTKQSEVVVKIKDNGPGVPDDIRRRIFDPFFTTKEVGSGTGIGLSICHRILEVHDGRIKVETTPGGGATFVVRLPAMADAELADEVSEDAGSARGGLSILVVDDEPDVAELLLDVLSREGHTIEIANSGKAALARIRNRSYDLVLSDIRMPGMDGPTLYRNLGRSRPGLQRRVVFITGDTLSPGIKSFLDESGRPYIEKPIRPQDVRALVGEVVGAAAGKTS